MAKLSTMFLILIALQAVLILYIDTTAETTSIWDFVTNIDNWNSLPFILTMAGIAATIGIGIIATAALGWRSDFLIFAPAVAGLIYMGVVFTDLARVIANELVRFFPGCSLIWGPLTSCAPINWILAITIGPIAFFYAWTVIEWWRGKDY